MSRRKYPRLRTRLEPLEARIVLGYFSADPIDEIPGPIGWCPPPFVSADSASGMGSTSATEQPVRHFDGLPILSSVDIRANALGVNWGHTRSWSGLNNSGPNGNGWSVAELPYLVVAGGVNGATHPGGTLGTGAMSGTEDDDRITLVAGGASTYSFSIPASGPYDSYAPWGAEKIRLERIPGGLLRLTDARGNVTEFYDVRRDSNGRPVSGSMAADLPDKYGRYKGYTPAGGGARIEAAYDTGGSLTSVTTKDSSDVGVERLAYAYAAVTNDLVADEGATPPQLLASVTLQRPDGSGGWLSVQRATYTYYTGRVGDGQGGYLDDPEGRLGDLKLAQVENASGGGGWATVDLKYYRYYKFTGESYLAGSYGPTNDAGTTGGPAPLQPAIDPQYPDGLDVLVTSGIKTVVEGASLARLAASVPGYQAASDSAIQPYVNHYFKYERWGDHAGADGNPQFGSAYWNDNNGYDWRTAYRQGSRYRVVEEVAQDAGCSTCTGGQGTYKYEYATNHLVGGMGYGGQIDRNVWRMKTTEFLRGEGAGWGLHDRRVVYTNEVGQPVLEVFVDVDEGSSYTIPSTYGFYTGLYVVDTDDIDQDGSSVLVQAPGHTFQQGDRVAIAGVLPEVYNGVFTVEQAGTDHFYIRLPFSYYGQGFAQYYVAPPPVILGSATATEVAGEWATYRRYDDQGRQVLTAEPSAVSGYDDAYSDLVHYVSGDAQYLRDAAGVVHVNSYFVAGVPGFVTPTETTPGDVAGYLHGMFVQHGELGTPIVQRSWNYYARSAGDATDYPVAIEWTFGLDAGTAADFSDRDPRATTYAYTWYVGTTLAQSVTVGRPVVTAAQHGPGTADVETTVYDAYGRPTWSRDGDGFLGYAAYDDATGAVVKAIVDVNTASTGDFAGLPSGWSTPAGGGLHLVTSSQVDGLGREVKRVDPAGRVTWTVYLDASHEYRIYRGWDAAAHATTGPIEVVREYWPAAGAPAGEREMYGETLTTSATPTYDATTGAPTGQEAIAAGNIWGLVRYITNAGGQIVERDEYYSLAGVTYAVAAARIGAASNDSAAGNHHKTVYGYDHRGRRGRIVSATGTITRTVYDGLGRALETWIGTDDAGATQSDPDGTGTPNNMVRVASSEYDGGGIGDGNPTRQIEYPHTSGAPDRVTAYAYDWRNRLMATKSGVEATESSAVNRPIVVSTLNNLGEAIAVSQYDGDGVAIGATPDASLLRAYGESRYDDQGRVYQALQYSVDPATGAVSTTALATGTWYDHRGQVIKVSPPGGLVTKRQYDGAGRLVREYQADGGGDASWADAGTVAGDTVLTQIETAYDAAGNATLVTSRERFHDNASTATGALGDPATGPRARVSYLASYYDAADRPTAVVDVGTNGGAAYTRPSTVPARSDTTLVTSYQYDAAGRAELATDPRGIVTRTLYDLLGRATRTIAAHDATINSGNPTASRNATTAYTHDGAGHVLTVTAVMPAGTPDQTTEYVYGVTPVGGSGVASNDLLAQVRYPVTALPAVQVVDDDVSDAGFATVGDWGLAGGFQAESHYAYAVPGDGSSQATWTFAVEPGATYRVSASWAEHPNRATDAPYTVLDGTTALATVRVDQTQTPNDIVSSVWAWEDLGTFAVSGGTLVVRLSNDADGYVIADSIRIERTSGAGTALAAPTFDAYTYNALGQATSKVDPNGTAHAYAFDVLGRPTADAVTALGNNVDGAVRRLETAYDGAGRASLFSSYDAASGGAVVNQVRRDYNGLGQLVAEYQAHAGSVSTSTTPAVRYAYGEMAGGANHSRPTRMTYPNGRVVHSVYNTGLDDAIGRLSGLADDDGSGGVGTHLEDYGYLGLGTIVRRSRPEPGVELSYVQQAGDTLANADGGDPYTGLDRFGRVIDQHWLRTSTGVALERYQYGYDRGGNRLYRANLVEAALGELYGYDEQSRLTGYRRGVLSSARDAVAAPGHGQDWSLDAAGNWSIVTTDGVSTARTFDAQNKVTDLSSSWQTPFYDAAGNVTVIEMRWFHYDAWNRLAAVQTTGGGAIGAYSYDALGRRLVEEDAIAATTDHLYYSSRWQVIEERRGGTANSDLTTQYVWAQGYVDQMVLRDGYAGGVRTERLYAQQDANYNMTAVVDATGQVAERYAYDPYGAALVLDAAWSPRPGQSGSGDWGWPWNPRPGSASTYGWKYLHQGGRLFGREGWYSFRNRDYIAAEGRWAQRDPLGLASGDNNLYRYENNNPNNLLDPSGLVSIFFDGAGQTGQNRTLIRRLFCLSRDPHKLLYDTDLFLAPGDDSGGVNFQMRMLVDPFGDYSNNNGTSESRWFEHADMAFARILEIRKHSPNEPIDIYGWSRGGLYAVYLANKLSSAGIQTRLISMIDPVDTPYQNTGMKVPMYNVTGRQSYSVPSSTQYVWNGVRDGDYGLLDEYVFTKMNITTSVTVSSEPGVNAASTQYTQRQYSTSHASSGLISNQTKLGIDMYNYAVSVGAKFAPYGPCGGC